VSDGDCDAVGLAVMEAVPVAVGDWDKVSVAVGESVGVGESVLVADSVAVALAVAVSLSVPVSVAVGD